MFTLVVWVNLLAMKLMSHFCKWCRCLYSEFYLIGYSGVTMSKALFMPIVTGIVCNGDGFE